MERGAAAVPARPDGSGGPTVRSRSRASRAEAPGRCRQKRPPRRLRRPSPQPSPLFALNERDGAAVCLRADRLELAVVAGMRCGQQRPGAATNRSAPKDTRNDNRYGSERLGLIA